MLVSTATVRRIRLAAERIGDELGKVKPGNSDWEPIRTANLSGRYRDGSPRVPALYGDPVPPLGESRLSARLSAIRLAGRCELEQHIGEPMDAVDQARWMLEDLLDAHAYALAATRSPGDHRDQVILAESANGAEEHWARLALGFDDQLPRGPVITNLSEPAHAHSLNIDWVSAFYGLDPVYAYAKRAPLHLAQVVQQIVRQPLEGATIEVRASRLGRRAR